MPLPDLSDEKKMLFIGRMTVLRKARRELVQSLRDRIIPMLNHIDGGGDGWNVDGIAEIVAEINAINSAINEIN